MPNDTPELCIDPISGAEVLYAPQRAQRANALARETLILPSTDICPFCPGHEVDTPAEVYRWPAAKASAWQVRIVPNRFPAVATDDRHLSPDTATSAFGKHEVLIESAQHDDDWLSLTAEQLAQVFVAVAERIRQWSTDSRLPYIQVFKNVGTRAGATLGHPHLQLMVMNYLPGRIVTEMRRLEEHLPKVRQNRQLVVEHRDNYESLCPPVSRVPYEIWTLPRQAGAFETLSFEQYVILAQHLQMTLHRLQGVIGTVSHNIIWKLPPRQYSHLSWRMEILPRLTTFAGLELGSGLYVNPIRPEKAAEQLSSVRLPG